jgi:hypothetical protein
MAILKHHVEKKLLVGIGSNNQIVQVSRQLVVSYHNGLAVPYKAQSGRAIQGTI